MPRPGPNVTSDADTQPGSDSLFPTGFSGGGALVRSGSVGTGEIADGSVASADLNLASVASALAGRSEFSGTYVRILPESYETFTGKADGLLAGQVDDTGGAWLVADNGQAGAAMRTVSGKLTNTAAAATTAAGYAQRRLSGNVTRIGARVTFGAYSTTNGNACLAIWNAQVTGPALVIPNAALHLTVGPTSWAVGYYDTTFQVLRSGQFATALTADGTTTHRIEVTLNYSDSSMTAILPDGTIVTVTDSHIAQYAGPYASWETFATTASTDSKSAFVDTWADAVAEQMRNEALSRQTLSRVVNALPKPKAIQYQPGSGATLATPTSTANIDGANLVIPSFVIPPSGSFLVVLNGNITMTGSTGVYWGVTLRNVATGSVGSLQFSDLVVNQQYVGKATVTGVVSGQTAGQLIDITWQHFALAGSTASFGYGGSYGPASMTAIPLG